MVPDTGLLFLPFVFSRYDVEFSVNMMLCFQSIMMLCFQSI